MTGEPLLFTRSHLSAPETRQDKRARERERERDLTASKAKQSKERERERAWRKKERDFLAFAQPGPSKATFLGVLKTRRDLRVRVRARRGEGCFLPSFSCPCREGERERESLSLVFALWAAISKPGACYLLPLAELQDQDRGVQIWSPCLP